MVESSKAEKTYDRFLKDCRNLEKRYPLKILQSSPRQTKNYLQTVGKLVGNAAAIHHVRKNLASRIKPTFEYFEEHDNDLQQALNSFMSKRLELSELLASLAEVMNTATVKLAEQLNALVELSVFGRRSRPNHRGQLRGRVRRAGYKPEAAPWRKHTKRLPKLSRARLYEYLVFGAFLVDNEVDRWLKEALEKAGKDGKSGRKLDEKSEELLDEISIAREKVRDIYDAVDNTGEGIQVFLLSVCHQAFCTEPAWDFLFAGHARTEEVDAFQGMQNMVVAGIGPLYPQLTGAIHTVCEMFHGPRGQDKKPSSARKGKRRKKSAEDTGPGLTHRFIKKDFMRVTGKKDRILRYWASESGCNNLWREFGKQVAYRMLLATVLIWNHMVGDERDTAIALLKDHADRGTKLQTLRRLLLEASDSDSKLLPRQLRPDAALLTAFYIKAPDM